MPQPIDVQGLWNNWQTSQRDNNIREGAVQEYIRKMSQARFSPPTAGDGVEPIFFEKIVFVGGAMKIRTADGRHRITAAHRLGLRTILAINNDLTRQIKEIFNI